MSRLRKDRIDRAAHAAYPASEPGTHRVRCPNCLNPMRPFRPRRCWRRYACTHCPLIMRVLVGPMLDGCKLVDKVRIILERNRQP